MENKIKKSDEEWRHCLSPQQFKVLRKKGTELPFTGKLLFNKKKGVYVCAACGNALFKSDAKFDSGTGWPSFFEPAMPNSVELKEDNGKGMKRVEVVCGKCGSHLGHVFDDGPKLTNKRYCINSVALDFEGQKK